MSRGDHREPIFRGDKDRELFLQTLGQACAKAEWQVHAWWLRHPKPEEFKPLVRGWCHGSEAFKQELLAQMGGQAGAEHYGEEIRESAEAKADRLVREELKRLGWEQEELERRRKGAPEKVKIALRLRRETTMTLSWIAEHLRMGTKTHLAHLLYWHGKKKPC
jgi:hypothetical protein